MALAVDSRQQQSQYPMNYDSMRYQQPQFTNPWVSAAPANPGQMYATSMPASTVGSDPARYAAHAPNVSSSAYGAQLPAPSMPSDGVKTEYGIGGTRPYGAAYSSAATTTAASYAPVAASHYAPASYSYQADRRPSHPLVVSNTGFGDFVDLQKHRQDSLIDMDDRFHNSTEAQRQGFSDALDASRGMLQMSQSDITPRNIYGNDGASRSSTDSYGFPASHSSHSSISSASTYPTYYNSSVSEASVGDYSSATESVDMPTSRTLPRPQALIGGALPPAPQSMMGQFSSKVSSSSQKKHKCKICDKRFTRPSSLQTHMYSHTGEKPFACDVEGCGRHFSVVSNLRRHRKVHKGEGRDPGSPDDDEE